MALTVEKYEVVSVDRAEVLRYMGYAGQRLTDELDAPGALSQDLGNTELRARRTFVGLLMDGGQSTR